MHKFLPFLGLLLFPLLSANADEVAQKGVAFLEKHCASCHGDDNAYTGLDMRDRATLLRPLDNGEDPFIVPGKSEESRLWKVINDHDPLQMPPEDQDQPSKQEIADLKAWIDAGAEFPKAERPERTSVGEKLIVRIVLADLEELPENKRAFTRYF